MVMLPHRNDETRNHITCGFFWYGHRVSYTSGFKEFPVSYSCLTAPQALGLCLCYSSLSWPFILAVTFFCTLNSEVVQHTGGRSQAEKKLFVKT